MLTSVGKQFHQYQHIQQPLLNFTLQKKKNIMAFIFLSFLSYLFNKKKNNTKYHIVQNPIEKNVERDKLDTSNKPLTFLDWDRNFNTKWRG